MPLDLHIIRASEFLRLSPEEHLDFGQSKEALELLVKACRKRSIDRAVLDLRALPVPPKSLFTPSQLASLVETFREAGFTRKQRLAVLYQSDPHHGARLFAFISAMRGWTVRAFDNFEQAILWLSSNKETEEASNAQPVKIQTLPPRRTKRERNYPHPQCWDC